MSTLIDIPCPACGRTDTVRKEGLATYWCTECDREFDQRDVEP